nr:hypothetical protein [Nitrospirillum amazonense]
MTACAICGAGRASARRHHPLMESGDVLGHETMGRCPRA